MRIFSICPVAALVVMPADAAHPGNAHEFINHILRPEVQASLTHKLFHAHPDLESKKLFVKPEMASNPTVFLPPPGMQPRVPPAALNHDRRRLMIRTCTALETGL